MKKSLLKPLAFAVGLGLCGAAAAATDTFNIQDLNNKIDPCADFNGFVNAKWVAANPIPADRTRWGSFDALREDSLNIQRQIVEAAARSAADARSGSIEQKIGYLYATGMNEAAIDKAGFDPIKPQLARIAALATPADITAYIGQTYAQGTPVLFRFGGNADFKDSDKQIAYAGQGGLGLPTPDYYTKPDYEKIRVAYVGHIARLLQLTGVAEADAKAQADAVMKFETRLAAASLVPTEMRKPENRYHYVSIADADKVTPHLDWMAFFKAQHADVGNGFSLSQPQFFAEVDKMLTDVPTAQWQAYLRFHAIDRAAP
jgi:putative endopeptidase